MPLRLRSFQEFAEEALPTPRWLVDELLPGDGWTLLVAKAKTGKSLLAMQLAAALSTGGAFLGRSVPLTKTAYVQLDAPAGDWQEQVRRLPLAMREHPLTATRADLPLYVLENQHGLAQVQLRDEFKRQGVQLVIWDALEKLSKQDILREEGCKFVLDKLRAIFPGPFVVIHHPRKPHGDSMDSLIDAASGHHYLVGDASAIWGLTKAQGNKGNLRANSRASDVNIELEREPETYLWLPARSRTPAAADPKYDWN